jgi:hypothetical protein
VPVPVQHEKITFVGSMNFLATVPNACSLPSNSLRSFPASRSLPNSLQISTGGDELESDFDPNLTLLNSSTLNE